MAAANVPVSAPATVPNTTSGEISASATRTVPTINNGQGNQNSVSDTSAPLLHSQIKGIASRYVASGISVFLAGLFFATALIWAPLIYLPVAFVFIFTSVGLPYLFNIPSPRNLQITLAIAAVLIFAGSTQSLRYLMFATVVSYNLLFIIEMFRVAKERRRIEQLSAGALGISLLACAALWALIPDLARWGIGLILLVMVCTTVSALLYAFITRSVLLVAILNAILTGLAGAAVIGMAWWVGLIAGLAGVLAFSVVRSAFFDTVQNKPILPILSFASMPFAILGVIAIVVAYA